MSARTRPARSAHGAVGARTDFRGMDDQQPIEPTLLLIQCAAECLEPGERAIERAFLFAEWPTGCRSDGERTIRRRCAQIVWIEQQRICGGMAQRTQPARFWPPPKRGVVVRWPRGYVAPIMRFEKIWIEQRRAKRAIKRRFGVKDAFDYLVGQKQRMFAGAARHDTAFRARAAAIPRGDLASVQRVRTRRLRRDAEADRP